MSIVVSTLTGTNVDPVEMAQWSYENGYYCPGGGSYHSLIPKAAEHWGLSVDMNLDGENVWKKCGIAHRHRMEGFTFCWRTMEQADRMQMQIFCFLSAAQNPMRSCIP